MKVDDNRIPMPTKGQMGERLSPESRSAEQV